MKIFISGDIEGVSGVTFSEEIHNDTNVYPKYARQMTREIVAAIEGAIRGGATEIVVKDGHGSGNNIDILEMPNKSTLIRGKSGHPYNMMYGLDSSFDGVIFVGYHSGAGSDGNPLSHTNTGKTSYIKINGRYASEFLINSYIAASLGVPVLFISGDEGICNEARELNPNIEAVSTKRCVGGSTINISPERSIRLIKQNAEKAIKNEKKANLIKLPEKFEEEIRFKSHIDAYKMSFYPGAEVIDSHTIKITADNIMDIVTANMFLLY